MGRHLLVYRAISDNVNERIVLRDLKAERTLDVNINPVR